MKKKYNLSLATKYNKTGFSEIHSLRESALKLLKSKKRLNFNLAEFLHLNKTLFDKISPMYLEAKIMTILKKNKSSTNQTRLSKVSNKILSIKISNRL